ncbi:unnamed protein product [Symbiodinium natans]|uniref:Uncharacterized protein n=1 Tax=Symbiodinium natans TaxID=878477 RepID=A0A812M2V1_9DINO|nr:unnamed protein product [Symbiodinium natans]
MKSNGPFYFRLGESPTLLTNRHLCCEWSRKESSYAPLAVAVTPVPTPESKIAVQSFGPRSFPQPPTCPAPTTAPAPPGPPAVGPDVHGQQHVRLTSQHLVRRLAAGPDVDAQKHVRLTSQHLIRRLAAGPDVDAQKHVRLTSQLNVVRPPAVGPDVHGQQHVRLTSHHLIRPPAVGPDVHGRKHVRLTSQLNLVRPPTVGADLGAQKHVRLASQLNLVRQGQHGEFPLKEVELQGTTRIAAAQPRMEVNSRIDQTSQALAQEFWR